MCPARHARLAPAGSSCLDRRQRPSSGPDAKAAWAAATTAAARGVPAWHSPSGPRPTSPVEPLSDAVCAPSQARRDRPAKVRPTARRPYFIKLALRGLTQGRIHGAPQGLDNGVGVHRSADLLKPQGSGALSQEQHRSLRTWTRRAPQRQPARKEREAPKPRIEPLRLGVEAGDAPETSCQQAAEHLGMCSPLVKSATHVVLSCRSYKSKKKNVQTAQKEI